MVVLSIPLWTTSHRCIAFLPVTRCSLTELRCIHRNNENSFQVHQNNNIIIMGGRRLSQLVKNKSMTNPGVLEVL